MDIRIVSSLEKCFLDQQIDEKMPLDSLSLLENEIASFQLAYQHAEDDRSIPIRLYITSPAGDAVKLYTVVNTPVIMPDVKEARRPANFMERDTIGLYPDILEPYTSGDILFRGSHLLSAVWVSIEAEGLAPGEYPIHFAFTDYNGRPIGEHDFSFTVLPLRMKKDSFKYTQWFHSDCLADYYHVDVFSEEHWRIMENYIRTAVKFGINMILTPIFTPPLDTQVGGERPTVQLIDVKRDNGQYSFEFSKLERFIHMCLACGVEYFEMAHLFTQWGANHAPKIMATENGEYKRIFGWETEASGDEYKAFLDALLPALIAYLKTRGIDQICYWHISDEPHGAQIVDYMKAKAIVEPYLKDYVIMDALSEYQFYESGALETPIPRDFAIAPFLEHNVPDLWTYYCMRPGHAARAGATRIYGAYFYKFNIVGFLNWGYNFYYSRNSIRPVDPYRDTTGEMFGPAGDAFVVYPGEGGVPVPSMRLYTFFEALQDMRALRLCEEKHGRDFTLNLIEETLGGTLTIGEFPEDNNCPLRLREKVNAALAE
ncbi:MAG: DUF4091 domain-containing protein [Clostridia bacterium]|nr:DUF4091 domain-containing protein [Clostridia bacterium]